MSSEEKHKGAMLEVLVHTYMLAAKKATLQQKNCKINLFGITTVLKHNCKRFSKRAIREKSNQNLTHKLKKSKYLTIQLKTPTHSRKIEAYPTFFIYVRTTFEHQVQDLYAFTKFKVSPSLRKPETPFRHQHGHQRADALIGSTIIIQKPITAVYGEEHQKTVNIKKHLENKIIFFDK